jgi:hypothetical protein
MLARSLTHKCEESKAAHPGDVYGGREVWQPSKKAGGWLSLTACHLPGEGSLSQQRSGPDPMTEEVIGGLQYGSADEDVIKLFGQPSSRGRIELEGASGAYVQEWHYKQLGLDLMMAASKRKGPQSVYTLSIKAPSTLKTRFGVGIGSPRKDVLKFYGKMRDPEMPSGDNDDGFTAGSIYGGVMFDFVDDKVSDIFLGAAAE